MIPWFQTDGQTELARTLKQSIIALFDVTFTPKITSFIKKK